MADGRVGQDIHTKVVKHASSVQKALHDMWLMWSQQKVAKTVTSHKLTQAEVTL